MHKKTVFLGITLLLSNFLFSIEKMPNSCQVTYGREEAPIKVTEYFSLSCPKCIESFQNDFSILKEKYIDSNDVFWTFHLHPADLLTLQAIICLEKLSPMGKRIFFETTVEMIKEPSEGCLVMQIAMKTLGKPVPELSELDYVKGSESFLRAFRYLSQPGVPKELPTVEIDNVLYDEFPNKRFLEKKLSSLIEGKKKL